MKNGITTCSLFGHFKAGKWDIAILVDIGRSYFMPVAILPTHKFYLDVLTDPESTMLSMGPYSLLEDSWKSMGIELSKISMTVNTNKSGHSTIRSNFVLNMVNDIGSQIGISEADPPEAIVMHALLGTAIEIKVSDLKKCGIPIPDNIETDQDLVNHLRESIESLQKYFYDLEKDSLGLLNLFDENLDHPEPPKED